MLKPIALGAAALCVALPASATTLQITIENLSPNGGFSLTPLYAAFHDGQFDAFTTGEAASPGLELLAELGDVSGLPAERLAVSPNSVATVVTAADNGIPPIETGETGVGTIDITDAMNQRYFTFLSMLIPTNDTFIGNGNPLAYEIFDEHGNFLGDQTIDVTGLMAYDSGTEVNDPSGAAFLQMVDATLGEDENGVVHLAEDQSAFIGLTAANGDILTAEGVGVFNAETLLARITITQVSDGPTPVPLPAALPLLGLGLGSLAFIRRRRRA